MRILVTGAGGSAAYNFVDAVQLGMPDAYVVGTDTRPYHLELSPLDAAYLAPRVDDPGYEETMRRVIERERIDLVHPQPDVEVVWWVQNGSRMGVQLLLPPEPEVALCHDKLKFNRVMADAKVPVPKAWSAADSAVLEQAIKRHGKLWLRALRGAGSKASLPVTNLRVAQAWMDYWAERGLRRVDFMASEFLPGAEFAWQSLWHNGRLVSSQGRERVEYIFGHLTPSGQSSSPAVARTVRRADVNAAAEAAVRAVSPHPHGVYCVDLKANEAGAPLVTEINIGRFFTTSNFFAHAGLNMPAMYARLAMGEPVEVVAQGVPQYDALPEELYWVRMIDMGYKLVKGNEWRAQAA